MKLRLCIIYIVGILILAGTAIADSKATVHGATYKGDTIELLDNTVVEINSTPPQSMVSKNGQFSFELGPGDYNITAKYYQNGILTYSTKETFKIEGEGNYVFDLLLLPVSPERLGGSTKGSSPSTVNPLTGTVTDWHSNRNNFNIVNLIEQIRADPLTVNYLLIALILFLFLGGGYGLYRKRKKIEKNTVQKGKIRTITRDFFKIVKLGDLSAIVPGKSIDPEIKQEFKEDIEEAVSVTEPGSKIPVNEAVTESRIQERKLPAESKDGYPAQEPEFLEAGSEEEDKKICFAESVNNPEIETPTLKKNLPLSPDLQEVMDTIRGNGGRITQKDLRSRLKYSEVKVSLVLSELEKREHIKKFKRGRGNVVILNDKER